MPPKPEFKPLTLNPEPSTRNPAPTRLPLSREAGDQGGRLREFEERVPTQRFDPRLPFVFQRPFEEEKKREFCEFAINQSHL